MEWNSVISSNVSRIGYDDSRRELSVVFNNGRTYTYIDVPKDVYYSFLNAPSKGRFVHTSLKNKYVTF